MKRARRSETQPSDIRSDLPEIQPVATGFDIPPPDFELEPQSVPDVPSDEESQLRYLLAKWLWRAILKPSGISSAEQFRLLVESLLERNISDSDTQRRIMALTRMSEGEPPSLDALEKATPGELAAKARVDAIELGSISAIMAVLEEPQPEEPSRSLRAQRNRVLGQAALYSAIEELARREVDRLALEGRELDINWTELGRALGVSGPTVYRRYDEDARQKNRSYQRQRRTAGEL